MKNKLLASAIIIALVALFFVSQNCVAQKTSSVDGFTVKAIKEILDNSVENEKVAIIATLYAFNRSCQFCNTTDFISSCAYELKDNTGSIKFTYSNKFNFKSVEYEKVSYLDGVVKVYSGPGCDFSKGEKYVNVTFPYLEIHSFNKM